MNEGSYRNTMNYVFGSGVQCFVFLCPLYKNQFSFYLRMGGGRGTRISISPKLPFTFKKCIDYAVNICNPEKINESFIGDFISIIPDDKRLKIICDYYIDETFKFNPET